MFVYETTLEGVREQDLGGFFVGWPTCPSRATHLRLLHGSDFVVLAREAENGRVVGFATAVGDGVLSAFIPLLEVLPEYQGRGIGSELVRRMLILLEGTYMIDLSCDEELVDFYERFQMSRSVGMGLRNTDALVG
ncbi:MAG: GNAT family N-acetyltransferase [Gaiellaceae bacterium]